MNPVKNVNILRLKQELILPKNPYFIDVDSLSNDSSQIDTFLADSSVTRFAEYKPFQMIRFRKNRFNQLNGAEFYYQ